LFADSLWQIASSRGLIQLLLNPKCAVKCADVSALGVQEEVTGSRQIRRPPNFARYTYYSAAKGSFIDCSLRLGMMHPDSMNNIYIETFSMIGKQMEI
jgi:hypothetical protein